MAPQMELLQNYYKAFNRQDWSEFLSYLHPEVSHEINQGKKEVGVESFRKFMERMNTSYSESIEDITLMISPENPDRASSEYTVVGKYLKTDEGLPAANGQTYRLRGGAFFEIENHRIKRVTNYYNMEEWLQQIR